MKFEEYSQKYQTVLMERHDGILQITLHTGGGTLQWSMAPHHEMPEAFHDIASDPENRVVIMTGAGDAFSGPLQPWRTPQGGCRETGTKSTGTASIC